MDSPTTSATPTNPIAPIPVQIFNDTTRRFEPGLINPAEVTGIADTASTHYGFNIAAVCIRLQLGPGKWAYIDATDAPAVRAAVEACTCDPATPPTL